MKVLFSLMDCSTDLLEKIKELASKLTPVTEISVLLDIPINVLRDEIATESSEIHRAFYSGMAEAALEIRERDIELARAGSPAAADALRFHLRKMLNEL